MRGNKTRRKTTKKKAVPTPKENNITKIGKQPMFLNGSSAIYRSFALTVKECV
ncbi:MAG TPA: hypothetical protein VKC89_00585 [Patescibacteria group bacterium]|nr:hypothetical protein [Patescibacteria group bacterium]